MPTKAEVLLEMAARLDAALIDPQIKDKRYILDQLSDVINVSQLTGGGGGGGSASAVDVMAGIDNSADIDAIIARLTLIADRVILPSPTELLLPQRVITTLLPGDSYQLPAAAAQILGLSISYANPVVCRLHLIANASIVSVISYRPVRFDPEWGHVVIAERSAQFPIWVPELTEIRNPNSNQITTHLTYQELP